MESRAMRAAGPAPQGWEDLLDRYRAVRRRSERICAPLADEDQVVQGAPEASPPKWHLAHTSWFFETFLLKPFLGGYRPFEPLFEQLFNSYYDTVGPYWPRARRGLLSRPTVAEVLRYRDHVDQALARLWQRADPQPEGELAARLLLGIHHEQQHQELLLTDIKLNFALNPLGSAYHTPGPHSLPGRSAPLAFVDFEAQESWLGAADEGFAYDNERPRHPLRLPPFRLAARPVSCGEYLAFMAEDGYARPDLWLADGWAVRRERGWGAPKYWEAREGGWWHFTLAGWQPVEAAAPVCHVSFYEADAYARWAGARLPREAEWELAAAGRPVAGNLYESGLLQPAPAAGEGLSQLFGDVWEWTASPYLPYPGYRRAAGPFGEYNGKFMCNQWVLRGGSCCTARDHLRASYRNFFYPHERWQFTGIRLALDPP